MNLRTDLAVELKEQFSEDTKVYEEINGDIKTTSVLISKNDALKIGKAEGHYLTLEFGDITDSNIKKQVIEVLKEKLKLFFKQPQKVLIIGLGNDKATPDALGPLTLKHVLVNAPLIEMGFSGDNVKTYAFAPSVMGKTGIETSDIIRLLVQDLKPDLLLVIDALASSSLERLNHTIQINDVGIMPGSGIGNKRKEITKKSLGVDVVALGVPTVVDAATIVSDTIDYMYQYFAYTKKELNNPSHKLKIKLPNYKKYNLSMETKEKETLLGMLGSLTKEEIKTLMMEVLTPLDSNLIVTPKEIDQTVDVLAKIIGTSINLAFNLNTTNYFD